MLDQLFPQTLHWEGLDSVEPTIAWLQATRGAKGGLDALYLVQREGSMAVALGVLAATDQFTPESLKGEVYYAILGTVFLASARPFHPIIVPKKYERLVDAITEETTQFRRTIKEAQLVGTLSNRESIKQAIRFLCDKKVLEPLGGGEFLIVRRPLRKLSLS